MEPLQRHILLLCIHGSGGRFRICRVLASQSKGAARKRTHWQLRTLEVRESVELAPSLLSSQFSDFLFEQGPEKTYESVRKAGSSPAWGFSYSQSEKLAVNWNQETNIWDDCKITLIVVRGLNHGCKINAGEVGQQAKIERGNGQFLCPPSVKLLSKVLEERGTHLNSSN